MKKKYLLLIISFFIFTLFFSSCTKQKNQDNYLEKNQEITLTGKVTKVGTAFLITTATGKVQELESYTVQFDDLVGQTVTVVGEFSGDTLYVTQVE